MEDIGDILFYVIAAAIGIIGAIANKKKKNAEKRLPQQGVPGMDDEGYSYEMDEQEGMPFPEARGASTQYEMIDGKPPEAAARGYEEEMVKSGGESTFEMAPEYEGEYSEPMADEYAMEGESVTDISISKTELGEESVISLREESSRARRLIEDFDLPSAIIYSEIINRKDFV
ncbi:MAG: hypothetical protein V2I34_02400 [Bacteroidales bacterium]|jgi:hypothetical protein|nr:hypothetical protein [Bacteroidales bacterium]